MTESVTHPAEGIYLSKFMAGVISAIATAAAIAAFSNLWYLNRSVIQIQTQQAAFAKILQDENAVLKGALPRSEWEVERRALTNQLTSINAKLDRLVDKVDEAH